MLNLTGLTLYDEVNEQFLKIVHDKDGIFLLGYTDEEGEHYFEMSDNDCFSKFVIVETNYEDS